ncbi:MAG: toxic anion resistance protein [Gammaproteobacteria bacterium]|nr:toxic anion resistance protein [Gammaproteobacteria bacterium]
MESTTVAALPGTSRTADLPKENDSNEILANDEPSVVSLVSEIQMQNSESIMYFGSKAQYKLTEISTSMLDGVKNKDLGPAGGTLNEVVAVLRGFDIDSIKKPSFFERIMGKANPVAKILQRYESVRGQIDAITDRLEHHKTQLLSDIISLDKLYEANLDYFHDLEVYIAAGDMKLKDLDENELPELVKQTEQSDEVLDAQALSDLRSARDELERRVHDLRLTRQVALQSLPSIRLVQENDKGLANKINSTIVNTVPLWQNQLAQALAISRASEAGKTLKAATDLTNELLESNAKNLNTANAEIRQQLERGTFDIESIKKANALLIATIEESIQISEAGKKARAEAVIELMDAENKLKTALKTSKIKELNVGAAADGTMG